jgi:DNA-binding MarR family transcriptional regulator
VPAKREAVADRLHSIAIHLLRYLREADTASGVGPARLSALSVLVFAGPQSLGELAAAEQVTAATMSKIVAGLEAEGLAARAPSGKDRRSIVLRATRKGEQVLYRGRQRRLDRFEAILKKASGDELKTLEAAATILDRLLS